MGARLVYSRHAAQMLSERNIRPEWVERTISAPASVEEDPIRPDTKRAFLPIQENGNRVLRVVYVEGQDTVRVVTAFFDRSRSGMAR